MTYRNYKHFSNEAFMFDVKNSITQMTSERNNLEFDRFKTALDKAIQRHAPIKKRYVRANQAPFINKKTNKEIMKRSRLRNKFLNTKSDIDRKAYNNSTPYCAGKCAKFAVNSLEQSSAILFEWLNNNYMKVNTGKSHLLFSGNSRATASIHNSYIELKDEQVLLGITVDSNLTFENHINSICKKASQKLNAFARIAPYMNTQKRRAIMKSFVTSQFSYCPLIWMFHSRRLNNKINSIHERALRITYQDNASTFEELLNKDNSVSIRHRNVQVLATEMFKIHRGLSPEILRETFVPKTSSYNLRKSNTFKKCKVHSVYHGTESLSFLGPKIWDLVPVELKLSETLFSFKLRIRNWVPFECPCRICKTYLQQVGFL